MGADPVAVRRWLTSNGVKQSDAGLIVSSELARVASEVRSRGAKWTVVGVASAVAGVGTIAVGLATGWIYLFYLGGLLILYGLREGFSGFVSIFTGREENDVTSEYSNR
ncbi:MAG: hypothetical protein H8E37_08220 [Planctomycetes bacterium]|nr:hypothetical protein [Planctomycetota bacterium]